MTGPGARGQRRPAAIRWAAFACILAVFWLTPLLLGGPRSALDRSVLAALRAGDHLALVQGFLFITHLGSWVTLSVLSSGAAAWLALKQRVRDALILLVTVWGVRVAVELQKLWIDRARPGDEHLVDVHSASFPSGHAANSLVTYLMMAALLFGTRTSVVIALMLSFLIGLSRPILGVHWLSDVIAGWAFALCCAILALSMRSGRSDGILVSRMRTGNPPEVR